MSHSKITDEAETEPPTVLVISDSEEGDELTGFSTPQKKPERDVEPTTTRDCPSARKKLKTDGEPGEELPIDIDSISTNPMRTRPKLSSDTSSKFPVSSPSDTVPLAGHRKKYVKNTLPAGAEWRMLQEIALRHPPITYREKLSHWECCDELSDVEDVNNFDDQFQKREQLYIKSLSGRRSGTKDSPYPNYNFHHFKSVILENLKGTPKGSQESGGRKPSHLKPTCSKAMDIYTDHTIPTKPDSSNVIFYEKLLCPSSESSTKASPSIRLHWTDEESVFRCNRLNPDIDKYSQLIKVRIDYNKQIDFKSKINEIFKTPSVPVKYSSPTGEIVPGSKKTRKSIDISSNVTKSIDDRSRKIETRRSDSRRSSMRSNSQRRSSDRSSAGRRSNEKFPEASCFQQDEFCNYLGLGMNGKVYSPTTADNKRRSLRVKRLMVQSESTDKKNEKKKDFKKKKLSISDQDDKDEVEVKVERQEVTTTSFNENRCLLPSTIIVKDIMCTPSEEIVLPKSPVPIPLTNKSPEIKIITQLRNTTTPSVNAPSSFITANSTPPPTTTCLLRTRATSNGTSTCPRSSQSDESPDKSASRRRRLNHSHRNDDASDLSESLQSDPSPLNAISSPQHNGNISTVASSEDKKDEINNVAMDVKDESDCMHSKYQRFLEESRKTKPSIFIVESIDNSEFKTSLNCSVNKEIPKEHTSKERRSQKAKKWATNTRVLRRFLRRNGTVVGTINQRILRNRTVARSMITKHQTKMKKVGIRMHLRKEGKSKKELIDLAGKKEQEKKNTKQLNLGITKQNKASQIDLDCKKQVHSVSSQVDPLDLPFVEESSKQPIETCDVETQTEVYNPPLPITFLTEPTNCMPNPLTPENGSVIYAYYELDILTIVQDFMVTFWKTCKLIQVIGNSTEEWVHLGECKRLLFDTEIHAPYKNRICVHNSIPIYMEIRAKELPKLNRDCVLISIYVNVYYYHDEELVAKSHSIQLDTVASLPRNVVYTTITDSRYFVMCWSQETLIGKTLSGLCKYSLTPHLDTLASIREFKSMRHEIHTLECTTDDNLIGFGNSQVTLWDHRSGDILMNYDLEMDIGYNVGSLHFPPLEVGHAKTVLIFQKTSAEELSIIAINVSHNAPSHQLVCKHILPPEFDNLKTTIAIDDYTILTNTEHQEIWIDHSDPQLMSQIKTPEGQRRFYSRCKQNVIVITENHLSLETFSSFVLKMNNMTGI